MNWRDQLSDFFYYHPKARKGIIFIVFLLLLVILVDIKRIFYKKTIPENEFLKLEQVLSELKLEKQQESLPFKSNSEIPETGIVLESFHIPDNAEISEELTPFDPNLITMDSLLIYGFKPFVARNIVKYREHGGIFKTPQQLFKVYGIDSAHLTKISSLVKIELRNSNPTYSDTNKEAKIIDLELNSCTAKELRLLRGIGPILSERIIKFRNKLGGFVQVNQLTEVYHLPDSTYLHIRDLVHIDTKSIQKLDINRATREQLMAHPYITKKQANLIVNYRTQHGKFFSTAGLDNIRAFDLGFIEKLKPYITTSSK